MHRWLCAGIKRKPKIGRFGVDSIYCERVALHFFRKEREIKIVKEN